MWLWLSLTALLCWSGSDLFSKIGCRDGSDRYSHLKMVIAVGTVMGLHAAFEGLVALVFLDVRGERVAYLADGGEHRLLVGREQLFGLRSLHLDVIAYRAGMEDRPAYLRQEAVQLRGAGEEAAPVARLGADRSRKVELGPEVCLRRFFARKLSHKLPFGLTYVGTLTNGVRRYADELRTGELGYWLLRRKLFFQRSGNFAHEYRERVHRLLYRGFDAGNAGPRLFHRVLRLFQRERV